MLVVIAALATWQIIEIWHHSLLFASWRAVTEMWENKLGELLSCPFCLSPWVGLVCTICLYAEEAGLAGLVIGLVIKAFAVARLANLGNDVFKQWSRTPKVTFDFEDIDDTAGTI